MKIKISEAERQVLDYLVAKCEGMVPNTPFIAANKEYTFKPSTNWTDGGPIIEREGITVSRTDQKSYKGQLPWVAYLIEHLFEDEYEHEYQHGPTPLIAAMRCYVASKLGDEAEVPDELA